RPADRSFVSDHQNFAFAVFTLSNGVDTCFFVFENTCDAFEHKAPEAGDLDDRTIRTKIAFQHGHAAIRHDRRAGVMDHLAVDVVRLTVLLRDRPACDSETPAIDAAP